MADANPPTDRYFLSYSRADERFALRFATDLRNQGVQVWVDQLDIRPSEHWDRAIERAVRQCRGLIVLLSPRSVASDNVADEISFAIDSGKSVLPVMIERCTLPLRITRMHMIDAAKSYERAVEQCLAELRRADGESPAPSEERPRRPGITDLEAIAEAKSRLTPLLGPIAAILVDKAAKRAASVEELYGEVAAHIDDAGARERFLGSTAHRDAAAPDRTAAAPGATLSPIAPTDVERITSHLINYLGPIAPVLVRRESVAGVSPDELRQRLAAMIPSETERLDFMRRTEAR